MAKIVENNTNKSVDGTQIFKKDYTCSNENSKLEIEFNAKIDEKLRFLDKEIAKIRYQHDQNLALTIKNGNALDVNEVNENNFFNACEEHANKFGALTMKNEKSNANNLNVANSTYCKKYTIDDEIREFDLIVSGDLDEKLNEIIAYYREDEDLSDTEIVDIVLRVGFIRCYSMNYLSIKSKLFDLCEIERCIDLYSDMIEIVNDKSHLINENEIKVFENFWIKTGIIDALKEKKFHIANAKIDGISSISLNLAGQLLQHVEDCISVYHQKLELSAEEIIERMIRAAINYVHEKLSECCDTDELLENNIFAYDHE
jgi:hypothetical protein